MKKAKYFICFDNLENDMSTAIEISKKEYERQISFLCKQVDATIDSECPITKCDERTFDVGKCIQTDTFFVCGCATTYLKKIVCKEGFCFAPNK